VKAVVLYASADAAAMRETFEQPGAWDGTLSAYAARIEEETA
jgi:hypothetical protein